MKTLKRLTIALLGGFLFLSLNLLLPFISSAQSTNADKRFTTLVEADKLYLEGNRAKAEQLYRQVKPPFPQEGDSAYPQPITDPEQLSGESKAYWRNAREGMEKGQESQIFVSLDLLLKKQPEFIPAYILYSEALQKYGREKEAIPVLEQAASLFPGYSAELSKALIQAFEKNNRWLEASIAARQFAIVNPKHTEAPEFTQIAEQDFKRFRRKLKGKVVTKGILGGIIGAVTGNGANQAVGLAALMLQGESGMGVQFAASYREQLPMLEDPTVVEYITRIGNDIANLMGRNDFKYEFYVVKDNAINAFALPGGKVFVNTGAILAAHSEAELAGLMGHEIGHAVLSHGFQRITNDNLLANLGQVIPLGNIISTLVSRDYSRQNEAQSDIIGTRVLASAGYAADGLRNMFVTMKQQERQSPPAYLRTHPATEKRVRYLEELIQRNGYNRYAFEGVKQHAEIKKRLRQIL